ncbi:sensor histidine kinase [Longitalea luteola]|uniref:sensor histidine kinase n=1 Tax=Longitalea luteola TaxID=2812563 RepID=UPI001A97A9A9|nr:ATP-binding protein [Longitalea luteola]
MQKDTQRDHALANLYEILNDCSIDRVMAIDDQGRVIAWNKTAAAVTGIEKEDIVGRYYFEVFPQLQEDPEMIEAIEFAMRGKKTYLPARPGLLNRQNYENHFIPLKDDDGHVKGVMNIMHDVSHREKAEKKLQQLNEALELRYRQLETASTEMATFTYITTNDIKEPLRHVYTAFELLMKSEGNALSNGGKANIRRIQASLNRMNLMLDDISALSQINSFNQERKTIELDEIFNHAVYKLQHKIAEKQAVVTAGKLPAIRGYKEMLQTLFYNLIDNSLKFQAPGNQPRVTISSRLVQGDELPAGFRSTNKTMVLLTFTDNGIGFDPADAHRIFIMFEKMHPKSQYHGSGMGLAIAKKIVEAHDGIIQAISQLNDGATFECYLPAE